jgi:hypothetical protein
MNTVFGFSIRFLVSFLVAKLLLRSLEVESLGWLLGLSFLLTANLYWFDFTKYSNTLGGDWFKGPSHGDKEEGRRFLPPPRPGPEQGS